MLGDLCEEDFAVLTDRTFSDDSAGNADLPHPEPAGVVFPDAQQKRRVRFFMTSILGYADALAP